MTAGWTASRLAQAVLAQLQDVLVHQRARWAALFGHQHQYEGWWKAEFAIALESWCWRLDLPATTWVLTEVKPRDHGVGEGKQSMDILVGCWDDGQKRICPDSPRVWIEIKERGTWWAGGPRKALCEEGRSFGGDLEKWKHVRWEQEDVVVAGQIISHDAPGGSQEPLPETWRHVLDEIGQRFPRFVPTRSVGCPAVCPATGRPLTRFATIEFFTVKGCSG